MNKICRLQGNAIISLTGTYANIPELGFKKICDLCFACTDRICISEVLHFFVFVSYIRFS